MSRSGGMSQLLKGIIIGVVLIMAIIGTMSMLDKDDPTGIPVPSSNNTLQGSNQSNGEVEAPAITLNPNTSQNSNTDSTNIGDLNAEIPNEETLANTTENISDTEEVEIELNSNKPVLEGEKTAEERAKELNPITYGMIELNAINPNNKQALKANYVVFDKNDKKVAESNDANSAAYRLPIGQYKVETTLTRVDEATRKVIPVVTKSRYMIIRENSTTKQTFEIEPPNSTGVLQVSAKLNEQFIRANFVVQKENGEVVASRNNVTNSLFKLDSGTYKVSVTNGNNKDFRSIEVKAGESIQTVFILKEAIQQGKLLVRVFDTKSSNPVRADITISSTDGKIIQDSKAITQTELTLAAGDYKIRVVGPNGSSNKNIRINPGQALNEIFRFEAPSADVNIADNSQNNSQNSGTKITDNVTIKPVENQTVATTEENEETEANIVENSKVKLRVIALDERTRKPIKSNIYIQSPAGKHLDKKTYVDAATFDLLPGNYKVTVRATNRKNLVKIIRITENQNLSETFLLSNPNAVNQQQQETTSIPNTSTTNPVVTNNSDTIPTGFLNVSMRPPRGQNLNKNMLKTHFIVATSAGKKIVELTSVNVGNFKLDAGSYNVTAIYKNKRRNQRIAVKPNKKTRLMFYTSDFEAAKGILKSQIVDQTGRQIKGNLTVSNMAGQIVARANNVSNASFNLPPTRHTVSVNFQGLSGSEVVNIVANETTVQTFTIAPNRNAQQTNNSRDIKQMLKDKIKEEIRKNF